MEALKLKDFLSYRYLSGVQYAPDGSKAAFVVANTNEEESGYERRLWLWDGQLRQLTDLGKEGSFLWEDGDIRAMAMIAHIGGGMGRINTVVTERNSRGRGYAGMLTAALCEKLLAQGLTPMLYADAGNPSSNRAYQKIGMEARGQVAEYRWK